MSMVDFNSTYDFEAGAFQSVSQSAGQSVSQSGSQSVGQSVSQSRGGPEHVFGGLQLHPRLRGRCVPAVRSQPKQRIDVYC
eukprot:3051852-Pyramimonas_sp.AAC.1